MATSPLPHEEPGMSPLEFVRLQEELRKTNAELAAANTALRASEQLLEQRVAERTHELTTLLRVSHNITTTLDLESLLGLILDQLREVVEYRLASISALDGEILILLEQRGSTERMLNERESLSDHPNTLKMLQEGRPFLVPDLNSDTYLACRVRNNIIQRGQEKVYEGSNCWMSIPLISKKKPVGVLVLTHEQVGYYTPARAELAMAFANYAAIAIENARLYQQAGALAAVEERQKLARELHDSVSQALYGIALGTRTARTLLEKDPSRAAEPLDYVLSLAETGLAEMRALILELRPESLQSEGLVAALGRLTSVLSTRYKFEVHRNMMEEPRAPLDVKEALYRIAQEALNNIAKHAEARIVKICLAEENGRLILEVIDDGIGFDKNRSYPGHLGMQTMKERTERVGGSFIIDSRPNSGTHIEVSIPVTAH